MYVKLLLRDLNPGPYPPYPISTYTYGVTIVPRMSVICLQNINTKEYDVKNSK